MQTDPARRRQAASSALWLPVGFGVGSFAIAGARSGRRRVLDRDASVRGMVIATVAACLTAAFRWRFGEPRSEIDLRRLYREQPSLLVRAAQVARISVIYGTMAVFGSGLSLGLGAALSSERRRAVPGFTWRRMPGAILEASLLMAGATLAVLELTRAVHREATAQPWLRRAHAIKLPPEPAIVAPGTAEEAFGDLTAEREPSDQPYAAR